MTQTEKQQLDGIIVALETVQAQAPMKTTYTMGRADHSISNQLLDIIRRLKALSNDEPAGTEPELKAEPEPAGTITGGKGGK